MIIKSIYVLEYIFMMSHVMKIIKSHQQLTKQCIHKLLEITSSVNVFEYVIIICDYLYM
jgi:hypothetical protein